jgi:ribosomal protein S18 acetylase RimI-like enzyme
MPVPQRIPQTRLVDAASRLVTVPPSQRQAAARQLIRSAPEHGIDLSLIWGNTHPETNAVEQVCLLVPAAGRTGMLYISGPNETFPDTDDQHANRLAVLQTVFEEIDQTLSNRVCLVQTLVGDNESWARRACLGAGMIEIGTLAYLKRSVPHKPREPVTIPSDISLKPVGDLNRDTNRQTLATALERSYIDTLDCPGLCDLREIDDVIDSHQATGEYDPALWWVVEHDGEPHGALLLARYPDQSVMELVYIGFSPQLRARGLGRILMDHAVRAASLAGVAEMTCAVDINNTSALHLYDGLEFRRFDARLALVRKTATQ